MFRVKGQCFFAMSCDQSEHIRSQGSGDCLRASEDVGLLMLKYLFSHILDSLFLFSDT